MGAANEVRVKLDQVSSEPVIVMALYERTYLPTDLAFQSAYIVSMDFSPNAARELAKKLTDLADSADYQKAVKP